MTALVSAQSTATYQETRNVLLHLEIEKDANSNFANLFRTGDEQIENLVKALDDSDQIIRNNAQMMIRYLGNPLGMDALSSYYAKSNNIIIVGPVPLPLNEWDYDFISSTYLDKPENFGQLSTQYLYALVLDDSPKAKKVLLKMLRTARLAGTDPFIVNTISSRRFNSKCKINEKRELAKAVLKAASFLRSVDKKHGSAKVISFNRSKEKALIEIYINHGVLAEEIYHVVINRCGQGWKFFSITLIANS